MKDQELPDSIGNDLPASVEWERDLDRAAVKTADVLDTFKDKTTFGDYDADGNFVPNEAGSKYQVDISDPKDRATYREMRTRFRHKMVEIQHKKSGAMPTVTLYDQRGERRVINEKLAEISERRDGFRDRPGKKSFTMPRPRDPKHRCADCGEAFIYCECGGSNGDPEA